MPVFEHTHCLVYLYTNGVEIVVGFRCISKDMYRIQVSHAVLQPRDVLDFAKGPNIPYVSSHVLLNLHGSVKSTALDQCLLSADTSHPGRIQLHVKGIILCVWRPNVSCLLSTVISLWRFSTEVSLFK